MGMMFVQALSRFYTSDLIAIDIVEKRLQLAKALGARSHVQPEGNSRLRTYIRTEGIPIDVVFDCSGKPDGLNLATKIVRRGGPYQVVFDRKSQSTVPSGTVVRLIW